MQSSRLDLSAAVLHKDLTDYQGWDKERNHLELPSFSLGRPGCDPSENSVGHIDRARRADARIRGAVIPDQPDTSPVFSAQDLLAIVVPTPRCESIDNERRQDGNHH